jgi:eukaryotic-like serine/threonine-protein kinase
MAELGGSLGDFVLDSEIGRGGMGVVYLARQRSLGRHVALKVLPCELTKDPMYVGRFKREAEAVSRLDHAHIVPVIAVGEERGHHYIAMKFVAGITLDRLIRARSLGERPPLMSRDETMILAREEEGEANPAPTAVSTQPRADLPTPSTKHEQLAPPPGGDESRVSDQTWRDQAVAVAEKIALALAHAHANGIVHRDVKPGNILIDRRGEPWLLDFGLVRDLTDDRTFCDGRTVLGTAQYMSPEQVRGLRRHTDQRSDVYSLGVTLYEMLTLTRPFDDRDTTAILHAVIEEDPPSPRSVVRDLGVDLESVVLKAMAKRREDRYASAAEFAADLRRVRNAEPVVAARPGFRAWRRRLRKSQATITAACLLAFAGVAGSAGVLVFGGDRDAQRRAEVRREADRAYEQGDYLAALECYGVFLRLGGADATADERVRACRARLDESAPRDR